MNEAQFRAWWEHMRQAYGIALRVVEAIPEDKIDAIAIPGMRTPKQLVVHLCTTVFRELIEGTLRGKVEEIDEQALCAKVTSRAQLLRFMEETWDATDRAASRLDDQHLAQMVATPWEFSAPGSVMVGCVLDEFFHHRGQLYAFVRALGGVPPPMWDFEHNAPRFQPKADVPV